jgi:hypothetical protein
LRAIDGEQGAVGLRKHRCLLRSIQKTRAFPKEVTIGEHRDGHDAGWSFDHDPAAPLLDEEEGVAGLALTDDHLTACHCYSAQAPRERPQHPLREREQDSGSFEHCDPSDHFVVSRPAGFGVLPQAGRLRSVVGSSARLSRTETVLRRCGDLHGSPHQRLIGISSQL